MVVYYPEKDAHCQEWELEDVDPSVPVHYKHAGVSHLSLTISGQIEGKLVVGVGHEEVRNQNPPPLSQEINDSLVQ